MTTPPPTPKPRSQAFLITDAEECALGLIETAMEFAPHHRRAFLAEVRRQIDAEVIDRRREFPTDQEDER